MRALSVLLVLAATQDVGSERRWAPFRVILEQYQAGETLRAIEALLALGPEGLRQSKMGVPPEARGRVTADMRAAAMLHTDTAAAFWRINRRVALQHIDLARAWADAADMEFPLFRRKWYRGAGLLMVEHGAVDGDVVPAYTHLARACETFPDDVALLTTTAWLEERAGLAPAKGNAARDPNLLGPRHDKVVNLRHAKDHLTAALKVDPAAVEPALRLGRVQSVLGDRDAARQVLDRLLSRNDLSDREAYVARLFMARFVENSDVTRARELYRDAVERVPSALAARIGLARLLYVAGDAATADETLAPSLTAGEVGAEDPWREYLVGPLEHGAHLRAMLRDEVQR